MNAREAEERGIRHLEDLEDSFPGLQQAVQKFFRVYKVSSLLSECLGCIISPFESALFVQYVELFQEFIGCNITVLKLEHSLGRN